MEAHGARAYVVMQPALLAMIAPPQVDGGPQAAPAATLPGERSTFAETVANALLATTAQIAPDATTSLTPAQPPLAVPQSPEGADQTDGRGQAPFVVPLVSAQLGQPPPQAQPPPGPSARMAGEIGPDRIAEARITEPAGTPAIVETPLGTPPRAPASGDPTAASVDASPSMSLPLGPASAAPGRSAGPTLPASHQEAATRPSAPQPAVTPPSVAADSASQGFATTATTAQDSVRPTAVQQSATLIVASATPRSATAAPSAAPGGSPASLEFSAAAGSPASGLDSAAGQTAANAPAPAAPVAVAAMPRPVARGGAGTADAAHSAATTADLAVARTAAEAAPRTATPAPPSRAAGEATPLADDGGSQPRPEPSTASAPAIIATAAAPVRSVAGSAVVAGSATQTIDASTAPALTAGLADTVQQAVRTGERELRIILNPPELGRLTVCVTDTSGGLRVGLEVVSAEAGELLQRQSPALQQALEARALRVESLAVATATESTTTEDDTRERPGSRNGEPRDGGAGVDAQPVWSAVAGWRNEPPSDALSVSGNVAVVTLPGSAGLLDVRA